jgi:hypothetical protein
MTEDLRERVLADDTVPEPVRRALESGQVLEEIRLDGLARWWHNGVLIGHKRIVDLFNRSVTATDGGTYVLKVGPYTYPIVVDDTPFFVVAAFVNESASEVRIRLNDDSEERLDLETLCYELEGGLLARVKAGKFDARFLRRAFHDLIDHIEEGEFGYAIRVGERVVQLASLSSHLSARISNDSG